METENIWWKKWLLIFHVRAFQNRLWFVSILTNRPTDRKYINLMWHQMTCAALPIFARSEPICWIPMRVYLGKNNLSIYVFRYIRHADVYSAIYWLIDISLSNCHPYIKHAVTRQRRLLFVKTPQFETKKLFSPHVRRSVFNWNS